MTTDRTHWEDCWKQPDHHACALARIAEMEERVVKLREAILDAGMQGCACDWHLYGEDSGLDTDRAVDNYESCIQVVRDDLLSAWAQLAEIQKSCGHPVEVREAELEAKLADSWITQQLTKDEIVALRAQLDERDKPCVWTEDPLGGIFRRPCTPEIVLRGGPVAVPKFCDCGHPVEVKEKK